MIEDGLCGKLSVCMDASNLVHYYDLNERDLIDFVWDPNEGAILSDLVGIPLGLVGAGELKLSSFGKNILSVAGVINSGAALTSAIYQDDDVSKFFSAVGLLPIPIIPALASTVSLGYDLGKGWQRVEYYPPIPR
jgi:hypothetical protein